MTPVIILILVIVFLMIYSLRNSDKESISKVSNEDNNKLGEEEQASQRMVFKNKYIIIPVSFAIVGAIVFSIYQNSPVVQGRKLYKAYFNKVLKDPGSLQIYNETYSEIDGSVEWVVDMGAKNSYGAMKRDTYRFTTTGSSVLTVNEEYPFYEREDLEPYMK